jgi:flagellar hook-length control protein FliK
LFQSDIPVPVQQPGWDQALAQRVQWMVGKQMQGAEIKLTPPNLGTLEVRVSVNHDQTSVSFTSPHASVRDAIETAMPRLRELLADNGLNLANVNVSEHSQTDQRRQDAAAFRGGGRGDDTVSAGMAEPAEMVRRGVGLLDTFA